MKLKPVPSVRRATRDLPPTDESAPPQPSDVRGAIDKATTDRLFGWAWDANHPGARLRVELRLAGEVVANTIADFVRPDLARQGVGDGCHAFEFPLVPSWIERRADLTAVAFGADGGEVPIAMRLRNADPAPGVAGGQLLRALETLRGEQESLKDAVQALRDRTETLPDIATVAAMRDAQDDLLHKVEQLELWLARLDGQLGEAVIRTGSPGAGRLDVWQAALIAVLASAASAALAVVVARFVMQG